jgi:hypothetical protein
MPTRRRVTGSPTTANRSRLPGGQTQPDLACHHSSSAPQTFLSFVIEYGYKRAEVTSIGAWKSSCDRMTNDELPADRVVELGHSIGR